MNIKDIIFILCCLIIFYLIYKTRRIDNFETNSQIIQQSVNDIYRRDNEAISNLSSTMYNILKNGDKYNYIFNNIISDNIHVSGDLIINNNARFTNLNEENAIFNIFPKYIIVAWPKPVSIKEGILIGLPKGWALCNGQTYKIDENGDTIVNSLGFKTPDLRSRFIVGSGVGIDYDTFNIFLNTKFKDFGGAEMHKLIASELPAHSHSDTKYDVNKVITNKFITSIGGGIKLSDIAINPNISGDLSAYVAEPLLYNYNPTEVPLEIAKSVGANQEHNNIPPYLALNYIIKL